MDEVRILEIKQSVFKNNDEQADKLRRELKEKGVFLLNLMSSPGAGKTTTLKATIAALKDKVFFTKVYNSISREHVENYLYRVTYGLMIDVVEEKAAGMTVRPEDKEFIANFYKYAFVGLTLEWVRTGMKADPAALVERVSTLIHGDITKSLEACRIDK